MGKESSQRLLVVWDPCRHSRQAFQALIAKTSGRPATVDLVAANHSPLLLSSFALSTGLLPEALEAEEIQDLQARLSAFVADLPENLGIRASIQVGEPGQIAATLLEHDSYDLVVVVGPSRVPFRRRALARRLAGSTELLLVSTRRRDASPAARA
jgi:hypothetical protein